MASAEVEGQERDKIDQYEDLRSVGSACWLSQSQDDTLLYNYRHQEFTLRYRSSSRLSLTKGQRRRLWNARGKRSSPPSSDTMKSSKLKSR